MEQYLPEKRLTRGWIHCVELQRSEGDKIMRIRYLALLMLALSFVSVAWAVQEGDTPVEVHLTVDLTDGSKLMGVNQPSMSTADSAKPNRLPPCIPSGEWGRS